MIRNREKWKLWVHFNPNTLPSKYIYNHIYINRHNLRSLRSISLGQHDPSPAILGTVTIKCETSQVDGTQHHSRRQFLTYRPTQTLESKYWNVVQVANGSHIQQWISWTRMIAQAKVSPMSSSLVPWKISGFKCQSWSQQTMGAQNSKELGLKLAEVPKFHWRKPKASRRSNETQITASDTVNS